MKKCCPFLILLCHAFSIFSQVNSFSFNINGSMPPGFEQALKAAGERWSRHIDIRIPIKVNVFTVNTNLVQASAITFANGRSNFQNAPVNDVLYPTALANQLANAETNPGEYDMDIYFNLYTPFYFGTGKPPANKLDLVSTAMHEIGHGLGFYSDGYVDASGKGSFGNIPVSAVSPVVTSFPWRGQDSVPSIFDKYIIRPSGNHLTSCAAQFSKALGDSIKNGPFYFHGPVYANSSHSNTPILLSGGGGTFSLGVDLLHLHQSYPDAVMSYGWGNGDTVRAPAHFEMGILRELGWEQSTVGVKDLSDSKTFVVYPNPASSTIELREKNILAIKLYDAKGIELKREFNEMHAASFAIDVHALPRGIYLLMIETFEGARLTTRVILN